MNNKILALIIVVILGIVIFMVYEPEPTSIFGGCEKINMDISCSDAATCGYYFTNSPPGWIEQQVFTCENSECFMVPSTCGNTVTNIGG